ncbi:hypothetical protein GXP74_09015 [Streptacidiphilus sp. P02-A3a]|nr:hypothetical protein GXP74_09015 [Streptacidiphilus sp. P02-A3a]
MASYELDDGTVVQFEVDPTDEWHQVSSDQIAGQVGAAAEPSIQAAHTVLQRVAQLGPQEVEVTFGLKVSGSANWFVAKAATEANFEVKLTWRPGGSDAE